MFNDQQREEILKIFREESTKNNYLKGDPTVFPHTHDGNNSPRLTPMFYTYVGFVPYEPDPSLQSVLPDGWTVRYETTGVYTIVHNLYARSGIKYYSIVACATQSTNSVVSCVISQFANEVTIAWFDTAAQVVTDTSFNFSLSTITNTLSNPQQYVIRNTGTI